MSAAAVVLLGSAASEAAADLRVPAVLPVPAVPVPRAVLLALVAHKPQLPALAPAVLLAAPPDLLRNPSPIRLPRVAVESEVPVHLRGRRSFSAAMARSSPPTGRPTY